MPDSSRLHGLLALQDPLSVRFPRAAISFSRGFSWPRDQTRISCWAGRVFTTEPPGKPIYMVIGLFKKSWLYPVVLVWFTYSYYLLPKSRLNIPYSLIAPWYQTRLAHPVWALIFALSEHWHICKHWPLSALHISLKAPGVTLTVLFLSIPRVNSKVTRIQSVLKNVC